ncbi:hypothetical protein IQ265_18100 [Nodosilinea sp. LEGE 06152]|uniref:hypothetical protein n=1 Tax=Nodosilinea sp. LEGE 06152 TaxID=2777966 RepID=UPI0018802B9D|nr:hypothetical protein [Nodosilinea sp. LEGE 06152]MBE9158730.1 hypothetical protein [Nodosilinea sp. LEGE 06152]
MSLRSSVQPFQVLGVTFWLLLPVVGLVFWVVGALMTDRVLYQAASGLQQIQSDDVPVGSQDNAIRLIQARVDRTQGKTDVVVKPMDLSAREIEIELATTRLDDIEALIAKELDISPAVVQRLTHYTIREPVKAQLELLVN